MEMVTPDRFERKVLCCLHLTLIRGRKDEESYGSVLADPTGVAMGKWLGSLSVAAVIVKDMIFLTFHLLTLLIIVKSVKEI